MDCEGSRLKQKGMVIEYNAQTETNAKTTKMTYKLYFEFKNNTRPHHIQILQFTINISAHSHAT